MQQNEYRIYGQANSLGHFKSLSKVIDMGSNLPLRKAITKVERNNQKLPLSFAQQRLWFIDRMQGGSAEYNMPAAMRVSGEFNVEAAEQALKILFKGMNRYGLYLLKRMTVLCRWSKKNLTFN